MPIALVRTEVLTQKLNKGKHMTTTVIKGFIGVAALSLSATAFAGGMTYQYDAGPGTFGGHGGKYDSIQGTYDSGTQDFSWVVDYDENKVADGGWLVVSHGKNPKVSDDELAILYFDRASSDVWAYAYNGMNNNASYQQTDFLGYFENAYNTVNDVATLALNAAGINSQLQPGAGLSFGSMIGIWFHPSYNLESEGSDDGLEYFGARSNSWYDTHYDGEKCEVVQGGRGGCITTTVPEPGTLALLGAGLLGFGIRRRRMTRV